jgi:hypothetical protein
MKLVRAAHSPVLVIVQQALLAELAELNGRGSMAS